MDAHTLNYLSLTSVTIAAVFAVCLPNVKHSIYFHRRARPSQAATVKEEVKSVIVRSDSLYQEETKTESPPGNSNNSSTNASVGSARTPSVTGSIRSVNGLPNANGLKASNGLAEGSATQQYHQRKEVKRPAVEEDIVDESCPVGTSSLHLEPAEMAGDYTLVNFKRVGFKPSISLFINNDLGRFPCLCYSS